MGSKAALAALGVTALVAMAGAGAFLASRGAGPAAVETPSSMAESAQAPALPAVEATEATVDEPAPAAAAADARPAPAAAEPAAAEPARRAVPPRRAQPRPRPDRSPVVTRRAPPPVPAPVPTRPATPAEESRVAGSSPVAAPPVGAAPAPDSTPAARAPYGPAELPTLPRFEEVTVPADAVIGLQLDSTISSDTARIEDRVAARVTRDVRADGHVAVPAGSRVLGSVSEVDRGGKMRERARIGVRFHTIVLADGTELPLQTETVLREGEAPANASAAKVGGGAIGGAILGAILGGGKGAAIGAGVGAGAGTAAVMAGGRRPAQIQAGAPLTVKVLSPVTVEVER